MSGSTGGGRGTDLDGFLTRGGSRPASPPEQAAGVQRQSRFAQEATRRRQQRQEAGASLARPVTTGLLAVGLALLASGCAGIQSMTDARGPQAERIAGLWWFFLTVCTLVFVAVVVALFLALFRRDRRELDGEPLDGEPAKTRVVVVATGLTAVILLAFLTYSVFVGNAMSRMPTAAQNPITVEVIGHQWWWQVRYIDADASRTFETANELRIPVGRPVIVRATSRDVIHSFWVPNLHGKIDLVPGKVNTIWIQADEPGEFRGQCAEFCGLQHALMGFMVVAEPEDQFAAWADAYRQPAREPHDEITARGREVFLQTQCSLCHTIRGTGAWGKIAPDLTRIGSRKTLAAGTRPNNRGNLAAWILDPQHIKPGNFMPPTNLESEQLHALLAYLESLK